MFSFKASDKGNANDESEQEYLNFILGFGDNKVTETHFVLPTGLYIFISNVF